MIISFDIIDMSNTSIILVLVLFLVEVVIFRGMCQPVEQTDKQSIGGTKRGVRLRGRIDGDDMSQCERKYASLLQRSRIRWDENSAHSARDVPIFSLACARSNAASTHNEGSKSA